MTWQLTIILQILVSSVMTVFTRRLSLTSKKVFFGVGLFSYLAVACAGWLYALTAHTGLGVPPASVWPYLLIEGICIPASWLIQYKIISRVGAGNAVIVTTLNTFSTALLGILLLGENLTFTFIVGALLVFAGVVIALLLKPDTKHVDKMSFQAKLLLTVGGAVLFAIGMYAEKVAINGIGVWDYAAYGWSLQAVGALLLYGLFGRHESVHVTPTIVQKGIVLGILTSVAGGLYIYALNQGTLSQTIVATSGKAAVVILLAALFLNERRLLQYKVVAFALTAVGLWFVLS
jgi:drug/metabolite transporter (DMT)-like permease